MSFFSNLFGLSSDNSNDSYHQHLHFPLMCGDAKVDLSQEDRSQVIKELSEAIKALSKETNTIMVLAILNRKAKKAAQFNFFLYMDENKEFHVIDYGQGIPATIKDLKVHKKTGQKTKDALQDLKKKSRTQATSLKDLKAQRKEIEEKILNLPYGVSPYPLEQKLKEINRAIKAKENFKAKGKKAKGKKAKGKGSNWDFMVGDLDKLRGRNGSALVTSIKGIAILKGYNRVVIDEKKSKAWFFKVDGGKTPEVYLKAKDGNAKNFKAIEVNNVKAKRKAIAKNATKEGMLCWS